MIYVFRLPELSSAGRTHSCFTSQLLLRSSRREETRERHVGVLFLSPPFFFWLCPIYHSLSVFPLLYTTRVERVVEGKGNGEDTKFDISKLAHKIQNGIILKGGNPPPSKNKIQSETFPCLRSYSFRFFFILSLSLSRLSLVSLPLSLSLSLFLSLFLSAGLEAGGLPPLPARQWRPRLVRRELGKHMPHRGKFLAFLCSVTCLSLSLSLPGKKKTAEAPLPRAWARTCGPLQGFKTSWRGFVPPKLGYTWSSPDSISRSRKETKVLGLRRNKAGPSMS